MKSISHLILLVILAITGCATSIETLMLERGQYVEAYSSSLFGNLGAKTNDQNRVVDEILNKTGGEKNSIFKDMMIQYMDSHDKNFSYFPRFKNIINQALKDKLLSPTQNTELSELLLFQAEKESIKSPSLLENISMKSAFPELGRNRSKLAINELSKLESNSDSSLVDYLSLYTFFVESKDVISTEKSRNAMRMKAVAQLNGGKPIISTAATAQPILEYIKLTGDRTLDVAVMEALRKIKLTRAELTKGDIPQIFPKFSIEKIEQSVVRLDISSPKDEFIVGEIIEAIKKGDEWLDITDEATRKLTIGRIRFQEDRTQPTNMTETVQDPSFVTLLMIPKNASVLFDYSTTEYSLQWNMTITDSQSKGAKAFSGQRKGKKTECRNMRYQNVFGGTGSIYSMPNDAVSNFCLSNSNVDFEQIRVGAINEIADEIRRTFLAIR